MAFKGNKNSGFLKHGTLALRQPNYTKPNKFDTYFHYTVWVAIEYNAAYKVMNMNESVNSFNIDAKLYHQFYKYFSCFGTVLWIKIIHTQKKAFITFDSMEAARRSLEKLSDNRPNQLIKTFLLKSKMSDYRAMDNSRKCKLLDMKDCLLLKIFQYLPFETQFYLKYLSQRFSYIFYLYYKKHKKIIFDDSNFLTEFYYLRYILQSLKKLSQDIEEIEFKHKNIYDLGMEGFMRTILNSLPNVKRIKLTHTKVSSTFQYFIEDKHSFFEFNSIPNLQELSIINFGGGYQLNESDLNKISKLKKLTFLDLSDNYEITGNLLNLSELKGLVLKNCYRVRASNILRILLGSKNIELLDIQNCTDLNDCDFYNQIINVCENLKIFKFSIEPSYDIPVKLYDLEKLKIIKEIHIGNRKLDFYKINNDILEFLYVMTSHRNLTKIYIDHTIQMNMDQFLSVSKNIENTRRQNKWKEDFNLRTGIYYDDFKFEEDQRYDFLKEYINRDNSIIEFSWMKK